MAQLTSKVAIPIILAGLFAITIFIAVGYQQLTPNFYIVIVFLVVFVFAFGLAIGQSLASPVKKILGKATELSKGDLSSRVYLESKDELSQLAEVFNRIAEELRVSRDQEANIDKSVNIKVKAKTKELEETINALDQKVKNRTIELERLLGESDKLQLDAKNKEAEVIQLRNELESFKQKLNKYGKNQKTIQPDAESGENK